jgi:hypothetical protein
MPETLVEDYQAPPIIPRERDLRCTVISIVPFVIDETKPGLIPNRYVIPAATKDVQILHVGTAIHYVYIDETRGSLQVRTPSFEVAKSIVNDYVNAQLGISEDAAPGITWVNREITTDDVKKDPQLKIELARLKIRQNNWFTAICKIADDDWTRYQKHSVISDFQRTAAETLGWDNTKHPWMKIPVMELKSAKCPACAMSVSENSIVCPNCKCILDNEKYSKLTFAK